MIKTAPDPIEEILLEQFRLYSTMYVEASNTQKAAIERELCGVVIQCLESKDRIQAHAIKTIESSLYDGGFNAGG